MIAEGVHLFTILRGKLLDDFLVHYRIPALCQHSKSGYVTFAMIELQSAHTAGSRFGEGQGQMSPRTLIVNKGLRRPFAFHKSICLICFQFSEQT